VSAQAVRSNRRAAGGRGATARGLAVPLLLAASGWGVLGLVLAGGHSALRVVAVFGFALIVPGVALVRLVPLRDRLARAVLAVALSMSLAALVAEATAINRPMRPAVVLAVLAGICSAAALTELAVRTWPTARGWLARLRGAPPWPIRRRGGEA
jgi:hypothetical protein